MKMNKSLERSRVWMRLKERERASDYQCCRELHEGGWIIPIRKAEATKAMTSSSATASIRPPLVVYTPQYSINTLLHLASCSSLSCLSSCPRVLFLSIFLSLSVREEKPLQLMRKMTEKEPSHASREGEMLLSGSEIRHA